MRIGSLFSGIGGLELGLERAGVGRTVWQCEVDPFCRRVLARHWPDAERFDDVRTLANPPPVDVICGGFPCQDVSKLGKGAGLDGDRSGLFFEAARIVRVVGPEFVVLENVAALVVRGLGRVLGELADLGYDAEWHTFAAASIGAPHVRPRIFIIAWKAGQVADAHRTGRQEQHAPPIAGDSGQHSRSTAPLGAHWRTEPDVGRVADGVPDRVGRLQALGNAVVPQCAEVIGRRLIEIRGLLGARG